MSAEGAPRARGPDGDVELVVSSRERLSKIRGTKHLQDVVDHQDLRMLIVG